MTEALNEHELAFVRSFVRRERRERFLSQMASAKKRRLFLDRLNHRLADDLDPRFVQKSQQLPARILNRPEATCHLIAAQVEYDGRTVSAREALQIIEDAVFGIVVSFVPGRLACYKDEAPAEPVWLAREARPDIRLPSSTPACDRPPKEP